MLFVITFCCDVLFGAVVEWLTVLVVEWLTVLVVWLVD